MGGGLVCSGSAMFLSIDCEVIRIEFVELTDWQMGKVYIGESGQFASQGKF